jgi:hypothetical protein
VIEKLVGRLRRLDAVLLRYQAMAAQLYDMLRVRTLDEVVPAVAVALQLPPPRSNSALTTTPQGL